MAVNSVLNLLILSKLMVTGSAFVTLRGPKGGHLFFQWSLLHVQEGVDYKIGRFEMITETVQQLPQNDIGRAKRDQPVPNIGIVGEQHKFGFN